LQFEASLGSKKTIKKSGGWGEWWNGSRVGPEFKPQNCKKIFNVDSFYPCKYLNILIFSLDAAA
jgi:hypothetical protein